jgi:ADP-heptose:LPS heptosyltransferase
MAQMQEKSTMALPTSPQEGVALLKRATLFISNDGGITHLSVVAKVKTVTIFAGISATQVIQTAECLLNTSD